MDSAVIGCVGDVMLDRFVYGDVHRISPEAPVPVLSIQTQRSMLGGLGNVVRNLGALGCGIRLFSVIGEDSAGAEVSTLVEEMPRCKSYLLSDTSRHTTVKVRYIAHGQQLLRADNETTEIVGPQVFYALLAHFTAQVAECSIVFLSDYAKGMLNGFHAQEFIRVALAAGKSIIVDPKGGDFERYRQATVIKPNLKELAEASGMSTVDVNAQERAARKLIDLTEAQFILLTRGPMGMLLVPRDKPRAEFPALAREVYDVSGAGDTVAAVLAAALGSGVGIAESVQLANIAAGIVVGKVGTATADRSEISHAIDHESAITASAKVLQFSAAIEQVRLWQRMGRRVGFTYGCFDPLSSEHIELLSQARSRCDILVIGLTLQNDPSRIGRQALLKDQHARALLLASLVYVDAVIMCDPPPPDQLMEALRPSLLAQFSSSDRTEQQRLLIETWNGELLLIPPATAGSAETVLAGSLLLPS